ncbi:MAG: glycosyltransferase [Anaeromyxobacter sp.]
MTASILVISECSTIVSSRPETELFIGLRAAGYRVTMMCRPGSPYLPRLRAHGIEVVEWVPRKRASLAEVRRIRAELVRGGHQLLFLCSGRSLRAGPWAALGLPVKVVAYRGFDGNVRWWDPGAYLKLLHPRIDAYWCNAASVRDTLRANLPGRGQRAVALSKGHDVAWYDGTRPADLRALGIPPGGFNVAFAANVRRMKDLPTLLRATWHVPPGSPLRLVLMGQGLDDPGLSRLLRESPMADRLHVLGPRPDALEIMAACDGYVLSSSHGESLTKSLLEAMCVGRPPVVTDVPGNRGIVLDRVCGRVVPTRDPAALGAALAGLAEDPERARAWGAAAREHIRRHWGHDEALGRMRAFVERLLAGAPADPAMGGAEQQPAADRVG